LDEHLVAAAEDLLDRRLDQAAAGPAAAAALVDGLAPGGQRAAQAHLPLQLLDLLDLPADLLLELGVDLLLDGGAGRVADELVVVEVGVLGARELLQVELIELAERLLVAATATREGTRLLPLLGEDVEVG